MCRATASAESVSAAITRDEDAVVPSEDILLVVPLCYHRVLVGEQRYDRSNFLRQNLRIVHLKTRVLAVLLLLLFNHMRARSRTRC